MTRFLPLLFLTVFSISLGAEELMDRNIAEVYLQKAHELLFDGEYDKAKDLLDSASEFSGKDSDYLYIKALFFKMTDNTALSLDYSKNAVESDSWNLFSYGEGIQLLLENLLKTKNYSEILSVYSKLFPLMKNDQKIMEMTGEAFFFLGMRERGSDFLKRGLLLYPESLSILESLFLLTDEVRYLEKLLSLISTGQERAYFYSYLLKDYTLLNLLLEHFGTEILSSKELIYLKEGQGWSYMDDFPPILQLNYLTESGEGEIAVDSNGDSWNEEILLFSNKLLTQWFIDKDQDGIGEFIVLFNNEKEISEIRLGNAVLKYFKYPYLDTVEVDAGDTVKIYSFTEYEGSFSIPGLDYYTPFSNAGVPTLKLKESDLFRSCRTLEYSYKGTVLNQYVLDKGEILKYSEDSDANGIFDHQLYFRDGIIISGKRDQNEDGYFEIHEEYNKGQFTGFALDSDGNNVPEFFEDWSLLHIMAWDGDQDSHLDDLYIASRDGKLYRQGMAFPDIITKRDLLAWDFTYERHLFR